tara:strand:+ start:971 stop:1159 length:189 start_codon:yes stop_codon:yes gene_type:complete
MQKMQILFSEPLMKKLKGVAKRLDIPVSEVVRRATDRWLEKFPESPSEKQQSPRDPRRPLLD